MVKAGHEAEQWNKVARGWSRKPSPNALLAEHTRKARLKLFARWADLTTAERILKTDLFEEAFRPDPCLFLIGEISDKIIGIDISGEVVQNAKKQAGYHSVDSGRFLCCDIRQLPFQDSSIDLIISDSTLDHFSDEQDIIVALREMTRVLNAGGTLILILDNKRNLTYPPYVIIRLCMRLGLIPYFIGKTLSPSELKRTIENMGLSVDESMAFFHWFHPDALFSWMVSSLHRVSRGRLDNAIRKGLSLLDKLGKGTKYLTGRYIAVKAVKQ